VQPEFLQSLLQNVWLDFLIVLFFGGCIFVHELGHYLAARARGVHVEVFSIGIGPPIFSWKGADGTRYQVAWFPLGGFVLLPQLADLGPIEGESSVSAEDLPAVSYPAKVLVFVSGAAFNVLFAFALACVIWVIGQPENAESESTTVGYIERTIGMPDGTQVASPAVQGGLRLGDVVKAIDGHAISDWGDLTDALVTSSGRDREGGRTTVFTIERQGRTMQVTLHPLLWGSDRLRRVGIAPGYDLNVYSVEPRTPAAAAGLRRGDRVVAVNDSPVMSYVGFVEELAIDLKAKARLSVVRDGKTIDLVMPPRASGQSVGIEFSAGYHMTHPTPFEQLEQPFVITIRTVWGLLDPRSDIGLSKVSGPVGIVHIFHAAAEAGIRAVLRITILINVNLAILNLLPIPVLDGGQILFATIARLRGRALPVNFVVAAQSVFMVLIFSLVLYISIFDVRRWSRDAAAESRLPSPTAPAKP
jgi:regulator of sigma E protease